MQNQELHNNTTVPNMEQEMKTVLRGYCIKPSLSLDLDEQTLYYLEPHGKGHYFCSKYPNMTKIQMGLYEKDRFKVVREEKVPVVKNTYEELTPVEEAQASPELSPQDEVKDIITSDDEILTELSKLDIEDESLDTDKPILFGDHFNVQPLEELPPEDMKPVLLEGKVYRAKLIYRGVTHAQFPLGSIFYITSKSLSDPLYNDLTCNVYEDAQCEIYKGVWSTRWFEMLNTVEDKEGATNELDAVEVKADDEIIIAQEEMAAVDEVESDESDVHLANKDLAGATNEGNNVTVDNEIEQSMTIAEEVIDQEDHSSSNEQPINLFDPSFLLNHAKQSKKTKKANTENEDNAVRFNLFDF